MSDENEIDGPVCEGCKKQPAEDPHPCPFKEEINDDSETLCNCCKDCQYECRMDI